MKPIVRKIKAFIERNRLYVLKDVAIFILITLVVHLLWRFWATGYNYQPIQHFMYGLMGSMAAEVYAQSAWIIDGILNVARDDENMYIYFANKSMIYVNSGCSGLKQIFQFFLLMLFFPGPWKKKLWFIPLGIIAVHITNVLRVVGLAFVMNYRPQYWDFSHDYVFRPLFYVVIFILWVVWVEKLKPAPKKETA